MAKADKERLPLLYDTSVDGAIIPISGGVLTIFFVWGLVTVILFGIIAFALWLGGSIGVWVAIFLMAIGLIVFCIRGDVRSRR